MATIRTTFSLDERNGVRVVSLDDEVVECSFVGGVLDQHRLDGSVHDREVGEKMSSDVIEAIVARCAPVGSTQR